MKSFVLLSAFKEFFFLHQKGKYKAKGKVKGKGKGKGKSFMHP